MKIKRFAAKHQDHVDSSHHTKQAEKYQTPQTCIVSSEQSTATLS